MSGKVFIVQEPLRRNSKNGELERLMDLSPAAVYGDLKTLIKSGKIPFQGDPLIYNLRRGLKDFSDDDFILPVGSPAAIAFAGAIAAEANRGQLNVLVWDREARSYIKVCGNIRR